MVDPLPGYPVTTAFGVSGNWAAGYHTGEDRSTRGAIGIPVLATKAGKISRSGWDDSYGYHIAIKSDGIEHWYCHLNDRRYSVGTSVSAGQTIGWSGNTGNSTGPHLHYEERTSPYGYHDHRKPQFPYDDDEDEDVALTDSDIDKIANRVWAVVKENGNDSDEWQMWQFVYWIYRRVVAIDDKMEDL